MKRCQNGPLELLVRGSSDLTVQELVREQIERFNHEEDGLRGALGGFWVK
jgi:hypothetical protein